MSNRGIKNPNVEYPASSRSSGPFMPNILPDPSMDENVFEQLLQNRGVRFLHKKAMPCPNMKTLSSNQHSPNCTLCDHDNFVYYQEKEVWGTFIGNVIQKIYEYQGTFDIGATMLTMPTKYPDDEEADFNTMDKLVMLDFEVRLWELFEWKSPENGRVYLRYPATGVEYMALAQDDSTLVTFEDGTDFNIVDGAIVFNSTGMAKLNWDSENRVGSVVSISYFANPVYTVLHPLRELRVTQQLDQYGKKVTKRYPQQLVIKRDFMPFADNRAIRVTPSGS
jgi:hypothetical protein